MSRPRWCSVLLVVVVALSAVGAGTIRPSTARAAILPSGKIYFPETGHHLSGEFLQAWFINGGLMTFGYPITDPFTENGRVVQYFERARFEYHEEQAGTRYVVQASLLGSQLTEGRRDEAPFRPLPPEAAAANDAHRTFFPETGHSLAYGFKDYWERHGGLWVYGYPISEEFQETDPQTGQTHTVQYFERARFEWHPEFRGTPYEVLLGLLGSDLARSRGHNTSPVPQAPEAVLAFPALTNPGWAEAIRTGDGGIIGRVLSDTLNVRSAPRVDAPVQRQTYRRHAVMIKGVVAGDPYDGVPFWYELGPEQYVAATMVEPMIAPTPPATYEGHWVDVNLSEFYAVAYDGGQPVYAAVISAGRDGRTPTGVFEILYRVRNETMDSATVGIPKGDPEYYYLENVQYTQYFKYGGYALHQNYWTPPSSFGRFSTNGCVGLLLPDAAWMWDFLNVGSTVAIHF